MEGAFLNPLELIGKCHFAQRCTALKSSAFDSLHIVGDGHHSQSTTMLKSFLFDMCNLRLQRIKVDPLQGSAVLEGSCFDVGHKHGDLHMHQALTIRKGLCLDVAHQITQRDPGKKPNVQTFRACKLAKRSKTNKPSKTRREIKPVQ